MRMTGMKSNEEEPQFTDAKEEAKYWRTLAEEYSSRFVFYSKIFMFVIYKDWLVATV